ncbi:MAG: queuosine precursor transporter [Deltaproteobacteria bacterium]|nr:queuosine precursor transporter [Deltaproteobacteria bacterium]
MSDAATTKPSLDISSIPEKPGIVAVDAQGAKFQYFDLVLAGFVTIILCSNFIGPGKSCRIELFGHPVVFGAGNLFFPISYIFDDVITEVYGYAKNRRVIWCGFFALLFGAVMSYAIIDLPMNPDEPYNLRLQPAIELVFGNSLRIVIASMIGFWVGDFVNSYTMAKMKIWTKGQKLWTRTIGSTIVGEGVDSIMFYPIAFFGLWSNSTLARVILFNWLFKVAVEVVLTPVTYKIVGWLKKAEGVDVFDRGTDFSPFTLEA